MLVADCSPLVQHMIVCFSGSWPSSLSSLDRIKSKQQLLCLLSSTSCIKMKNNFSSLCVFVILSLFPDMRNTIANVTVVIIVIIFTILRCCCSGVCRPALARVVLLVLASYFLGFICRET